jgi:hypothetical protein
MSYEVAESELLIEERSVEVTTRSDDLQSPVRTGSDFTKEVNGNLRNRSFGC